MKAADVTAQVGYRKPRHKAGKAHIVASNTLVRQFNPAKPDQAWVTDITDIKTHEEWPYGYRKDKHPFHPSPIADDYCRIDRQPCNTSLNPAAMEPGLLKPRSLLSAIGNAPAIGHTQSVTQW